MTTNPRLISHYDLAFDMDYFLAVYLKSRDIIAPRPKTLTRMVNTLDRPNYKVVSNIPDRKGEKLTHIGANAHI